MIEKEFNTLKPGDCVIYLGIFGDPECDKDMNSYYFTIGKKYTVIKTPKQFEHFKFTDVFFVDDRGIENGIQYNFLKKAYYKDELLQKLKEIEDLF
jgi:hypothetical protein